MQIKQQKNLAHKTGPHNSLPKTNGFLETTKDEKVRWDKGSVARKKTRERVENKETQKKW
jgi:hypothetical protein